jgi:hypothetical protein
VIILNTGVNPRTPCRQLFKELNILTIVSLYIFGSDKLFEKTPPVCRAQLRCSYLEHMKEEGYSHPIIQD